MSLKSTYCHVLIFLLFARANTQPLRRPLTAHYTGLGAYSLQHPDVLSVVHNQAILAKVSKTAAGVYGERRFMLQATNLYMAVVAMPSGKGNFGVNLKYSGFKNYNEYQVGLAYARSLGSGVDFGVQFNYNGYRVPTIANAQTVTIEMGALIHLTEKLNAGIQVYNPLGGRLSKWGEKLVTAFKLGVGYDVSELFYVGSEITKETGVPLNVTTGIQYRYMKQFFIRAGIVTATATPFGGVGVGWNNLRLDISGSYHPQLGWSPGLMLVMNMAEERDALQQPY